jgi:CBS domain-containing membrane protein
MKKLVPVSTIMTRNIVKLNLTDDLTKAEMLFKKHHIRHIPVVVGNKIVGMLSYTDLLRISFADAIDDDEDDVDTTVYNMFTVEQVMAKKVVSITSNTTIKEAAEILASHEFHALPVCEGELLVGIITTTDLINYLIDQYKKEA